MRLLRLFIGRNQRSDTNGSPVRRKKRKISRYKRALAEVEGDTGLFLISRNGREGYPFLTMGEEALKEVRPF